MQPRDAIVTIHREVTETEEVRAKVWPVAMGANELLVEYEDGAFGAVNLQDIRVGIMGYKCPHCNPDELLPIKEKGPNTIRLIHGCDTWYIAVNIEFEDGTFLQNGKEIRRAVFSEPIDFCPKCGRKLV